MFLVSPHEVDIVFQIRWESPEAKTGQRFRRILDENFSYTINVYLQQLPGTDFRLCENSEMKAAEATGTSERVNTAFGLYR